MPKRSPAAPSHSILLGDAAASLEIVVNLLLDVIAVSYPPIAAGVVEQLDAMLAHRLPTPGLHARLAEVREHLASLIPATGSGLPN